MGSIAVIGAGNVGVAISGHMSLKGHDVRLYDPWGADFEEIECNGGIELIGEVEGIGKPAVLTTSMDQAVRGVEIIIVTAPAFSHDQIAEGLVAVCESNQIVLFQPGALGSGVQLLRKFADAGKTPSFVAESLTSLYTCRKKSATEVYVGAIKYEVGLSAIPSADTGHCVEVFNSYFGDRYVAGDDALTVGLSNINPVYHVPPSVLNFKTVEDGCEYPLHTLVSPRVAEVVDLMDKERLKVAEALSVESMSFWEFLDSAYGVREGSYQERIIQSYGRQAFLQPDSPRHRYFTEDIPFGMVPWLSLARELSVSVPITESLTVLASALCDEEFISKGRTLETLGLNGAGREGIRNAFIDGIVAKA